MIRKLDETIFHEFVPVYDQVGDIGELMAPEKEIAEAEKAKFRENRAYQPNLRVDTISREELQGDADRLADLTRRLGEVTDPSIRKAYEWQIAELNAHVGLVAAVANNNAEEYDRIQTEIYGPFDKVFASDVLAYFFEKAKQLSDGGTRSLKAAAYEVMRSCGPVRNAAFQLSSIYPDYEEFEIVKRQHKPYYDRLLSGIAIPEVVTYADRQKIIPKLLDNIGVPDGMYAHVPRKKGITTWSISHTGKGEIRDPVDRDMSAIRFKGLIDGHEVGTHVSERVNAMHGPIGLLEYGLHRYVRAGEGKGVMREMVVYDALDQYQDTPRDREILLRTALSAYPRLNPKTTFDGWFTFAESMKTLWQLEDEPDLTIDEARSKVFDPTWNSVKRAWRGGLYKPDGSIMASRRDEVYAKGMVEQFAVASHMPKYVDYADLGKFDLANPLHVEWMQTWGILPEIKTT